MNRPTHPATYPPGHPIGHEELMAYLDGELPIGRAAEVASHLDLCRECQALADDLRSLDQQIAAWQVEPSPASLAERVKAAMEARPEKASSDQSALFAGLDQRPVVRQWVWAVAAVTATALFVLVAVSPNLLRKSAMPARLSQSNPIMLAPRLPQNYESAPASRMPPVNGRDMASISTSMLTQGEKAARAGGGGGGGARGEVAEEQSLPEGPMIVRTASLTLVTKEFDKARPAVEEIVRQHHGYAAELTVNAPGGAGRTLTATLRVPADQLDAALEELKKLGRVEQESQGGEEVTQQYIDLNARLKNARTTEERLIDVLRERTGKVKDVLAVEQEIARVRGEIEQMEAESKNLEHQVRYAALELRLSEEYKAALEVAPPSTGTQLRNSLVDGYRGVVDSAVGFLMFLAF